MIKNFLRGRIAEPVLGAGLFSIFVLFFYAFFYPYHLHFQEQFQFFVYTDDYFFSFIRRPGGLSDFLGYFFAQFYFYSWVGAFVIAFLLVSLQVLVLRLILRFHGGQYQSFFLPLSFIPAILYWALLCNEDYLLGGLVALVLVSWLMLLYSRVSTRWGKGLLAFVLLPLFYWMVGGIILFYVIFVLFREWVDKKFKFFPLLSYAFLAFGLIFIVVFFAKGALGLMYPTSSLLVGVRFFRYPAILPVWVGIVALVVVLIPFFSRLIIGKSAYSMKLILFSHWFLLVVGSVMLIYFSADMDKEEIMAYDFNIRMRRWSQVVDMAEQKAPSSPLTVACLNLALAKTGLIGDKLFSYYQNGPQGLIPDFKRDYLSFSVTGDIYYHLGMINTAQRYAFEAMEALPDYQKSVRSVKRLAETNLINGNYDLSRKYLSMLCRTTYYKKWARLVLDRIGDEDFINSREEWGHLRRFKPTRDFFFSEGEKDMMLGLLFTHNPNNKLVFDYLLTYCLLNKDLQHFVRYFPMGSQFFKSRIPEHYQEAIFMFNELSANETKLSSFAIDDLVKQRFAQYTRIYNRSDNAKHILKADFGDTFWCYLHF
jgi:hypothetical protein